MFNRLRPLLTHLAVLPLIAYSVLLGISATPGSLTVDWNEALVRSAQKTLWRARIRAGRPVFEGARNYRLVIRTVCFVVVGDDVDGGEHVLHEDYPGCVSPRVRVFNDLWNLALYATIGRDTGYRLAVADDHEAQLRRLRTRNKLSRVSDYFCDHPPNGVELARVRITAYTETATYQDDERETRHDVIHAYDCQKRVRTAAGNLVAHFDDEGRVRVKRRTLPQPTNGSKTSTKKAKPKTRTPPKPVEDAETSKQEQEQEQ